MRPPSATCPRAFLPVGLYRWQLGLLLLCLARRLISAASAISRRAVRTSLSCIQSDRFVPASSAAWRISSSWIADAELEDAYTFLALERDSKLLLAHHVGPRTASDAHMFAAKLSAVVGSDRFQISTDGLEAYPAALESHFGGRID
jgi:hypothetical protein